MIAETIPQILTLSNEDKLRLAAELVRDAVGGDEDVVLDSETVAMLQESLSDYQSNPDQGTRWEEIRDRLSNREFKNYAGGNLATTS